MPSAKRSPITYAPAFGGGIFRSKSEIDGDLALLEHAPLEDEESPAPPPNAPTALAPLAANERTNERTKIKRPKRTDDAGFSNERTNERTVTTEPKETFADPSFERTNERTNDSEQLEGDGERIEPAINERTNERTRVRHSFDVYRDQLLSLGDIQLARHRQTGRKPKLGDLVQEALDAFVARHQQASDR